MDKCIGLSDISEILLKTMLKTIQSINQSSLAAMIALRDIIDACLALTNAFVIDMFTLDIACYCSYSSVGRVALKDIIDVCLALAKAFINDMFTHKLVCYC